MKSVIVLCIMLVWAFCASAFEVREIPLASIEAIAMRNAKEQWGEVFADTPIPLYDAEENLVAWQYNFSLGKPFPNKQSLLERIKAEGSTLYDAAWNQAEFVNLVLGARSDQPVIIGYSKGLSEEYSNYNLVDKLAQERFSQNYKLIKEIFIGFGWRWTKVQSDQGIRYVKALPPYQVCTAEEFATQCKNENYPTKNLDYSAEWDNYLNGNTLTRDYVYVPNYELMPYIRWSYGCSPTSGVTLAAYMDYDSINREGDFSTSINYYLQRYDSILEETCFHVPSALYSIQDYMWTDDDWWGATLPFMMDYGMKAFYESKGHAYWGCYNSWNWDYLMSNTDMFNDFRTEINWGCPTLMNTWNHTICAMGYSTSGQTVIVHDSNWASLRYWNISNFYYTIKVHPRPKDGASVIISQPDGGHDMSGNGAAENLHQGEVYEIRWTGDYLPETHVEILYTTNMLHPLDGAVLITSNAPNIGYYPWKVPPNLESENVRILITIKDNANQQMGSDGSYGHFSVTTGGSIPVLVNDTAIPVPQQNYYATAPTSSAAWTAAGLWKNDTNSAELSLYNDDFSTRYGISTEATNTNWVIVDRNHTPATNMGVGVRFDSYAATNRLELEGGASELGIGISEPLIWATDDIVKMWDVPLSPGFYSISINHSSGYGDLGVALYGSQDGAYYHTRDTALGISDSDQSLGLETFSVYIDNSDRYGLLVWSNNRASFGTYRVTIAGAGMWTGASSTNWNTATNWASGNVPSSSTDVMIPGNAQRMPSIAGGITANCGELAIESDARLDMGQGTLNVSGSILISGTLKTVGSGTVNVSQNVIWMQNSSYLETATCSWNLTGNWSINSGTQMDLQNANLNFVGSQNSRITSYATNTSLWNLNVNKAIGYELKISDTALQPLKVNNLSVGAGSIFRHASSRTLYLKGNLASAGGIRFDDGTIRFYGSAAQSIGCHPNDIFNNLDVFSTNQVSFLSSFTVMGDVNLISGTMNLGSNIVSLHADWNGLGGTIADTNYRIKFCGAENSLVNQLNAKTIELDKDNSAELIVIDGSSVICTSYDWTTGSLRVEGGGSFIANDLADIRIMGKFRLEDNGLIELHQDTAQYIDLDADLYIYGGSFNIYGGFNYPSEWAYTRAITVYIAGGVLDFKDNGIFLQNTGYYLNDIISGGTIRTSGDFKVERSGFNPTGGTVEMYGSGTAILHVNSPSDLCILNIDKNSRENVLGSREERINQVTVDSDTKVANYCNVFSGILQISSCRLTVVGYMSIYGALRMDDQTDILDVNGGFAWMSGSSAVNLTGGLMIHHNNVFLTEGCNVQLSAAVTTLLSGGRNVSVNEPSSALGTVIMETTAYYCYFDGSHPININGDLVIKPNATLKMHYGSEINVSGKIDIWNLGTMLMSGYYTVTTYNLYNSGQLIFESGCQGDFTVSNTFLQYSSGSLGLHAGNLIINAAYTGALYAFAGTTTMSGGTLQITNNGLQIGTSGFTFTGGIIKLGWSFLADTQNTFQPNSGTIEMIGALPSTINLGTGNFLPNLVINKSESTGAVELQTDVLVKMDLSMLSGKLSVNHQKLSIQNNLTLSSTACLYGNNSDDGIEIGGNWINNGTTDNFLEGTGLVTFVESSNAKSIGSNETFYRLKIAANTDMITVLANKTITVGNNLDITSGRFRPLEGTTMNVTGNVLITGASSYWDQDFIRFTNRTNLMIQGNLAINQGSYISKNTNGNAPKDIININGNLAMTGGEIDTKQAAITLTGELTTSATSAITMKYGTFVNAHTATWQLINCPWNIQNNTLEFSNKGLQFISGANIEYNMSSVIKTGKSLMVTVTGVLDGGFGTIEFIGSTQANINIANNNKLPSLKINKTAASVILSTPIIVTDKLIIASGAFNSLSYAVEIQGDWQNYVGSGGYTCGTSVVTFNNAPGYSFQGITGEQTFYKLIFAHPVNHRYTTLSSGPVTVLNDVDILSGGLFLSTDALLQVNNNLSISDGAFLRMVEAELAIKGNLTDNNTQLCYTDQFTLGLLTTSSSTIRFNGTGTQSITNPRPNIELGNFILNKSSGAFQPNKPMIMSGSVTVQSGNWGYGVSGLTHSIQKNLTIDVGSTWNDNTGTLQFNGTENSTITNAGTANFKNIWIDKTPSRVSGPTVYLGSNITVNTSGTFIVDGGVLNLAVFTLQTNGNVDINSEGKLLIGTGGILKMLSGSAINVNEGGTLALIGSTINPATISHVSGNYSLVVNSGGTLSAECAVFEYTGTNGVYVMSGGLIDPDHPLSYCTFRYGYSSGTLLRLDNAQNLVIDHAYFPSGATSFYNVSKTVNQGTVQFTGETGDWAGSLHENDLYFRINWSADVPQIQVNPATFNFGEVPYTQSSSRHILISNPGSAVLYGSITTPPNFSIAPWGRGNTQLSGATDKPEYEQGRNVLDFGVSIGGSAEFVITFTPTEPIYYSGTVVVTHNAASSPFNVFVDGYGCGSRIAVDHAFFNIDIEPGGTAHRLLNLSNTGVDSLSYSGWVNYSRDDRNNLLYTGFEDGCPPAGWAQQQTMGTEAYWDSRSVVQNPSGNPYTVYAGNSMGYFNSYSANGGNRARLESPVINLDNYSGLTLSFWMLHDEYYETYPPDTLQVQVTTDGFNWYDAGIYILRRTMPYGWRQHVINLSAYDLSPNLQIGFLGKSGYGNDMYIDEIQLTGNYQLPTNWIQMNGESSISGFLNPEDPPLAIDVSVDTTGIPSGWYMNQLRFMSNDPGNPDLAVNLNIKVGTPDYTFSPSALNFSNVEVGETDTLGFEIVNTGEIGLSGTVSSPPGYTVELTSAPRQDASAFITSRSSSASRNDVEFYLSPGINATFAVYFSPSETTAYNGQITISTNTGIDEYLPVSGAGVSLPVVSTEAITDIAVQSATGGGNVSSDGNLPILERGICWYTTANPTLDNYHAEATGTTGAFTIDMTNLLHMQEYFVRAYATNALGTAYGEQVSFTTLTPWLITNPSTVPDFGNVPVGETSAAQSLTISGGNLVDMVMLSSPNGYQISLSPDGDYTMTLNLDPTDFILPETTVYVRFTPIETGIWPGLIVPLTVGGNSCDVSLSGNGVTTPAVETATVVFITTETASVNARILDDGFDPVSACGVCWNTTTEPDIADSHTDEGNQTGWFTSELTDLSPNTQYYVRSYAQNVAGLVYGNEVSFFTVSIPQISVVDSLLDSFGKIVVGEISEIDTFMVSATQLMDDLIITAPEGFELSLSSSGRETREFTPQIILTPTAGNIALTSVYVRFSPASGGNLSDYLSCESLGMESVNTLLNGTGVITPTLTTTPASEITFNTAITGGEIIHNGWDSITACGVCYSISENPTLADAHTEGLTLEGEFVDYLDNLLSDTTYYIRAYATNSAGTSYGTQLSFTTALGVLDPPQNIRISMQGSDITLEWDAVTNAISYKIYRSTDPYSENWGLPFAVTSSTSWLDTNPSDNFFYRVVASSEPVR